MLAKDADLDEFRLAIQTLAMLIGVERVKDDLVESRLHRGTVELAQECRSDAATAV